MGVITDIKVVTKDLVSTSHSIQQIHGTLIPLLTSSPLPVISPSSSPSNEITSLINLHSTFINKCARLFSLVSLLESKATALDELDVQLQRLKIREDKLTSREILVGEKEQRLKIDYNREEEVRQRRKMAQERQDKLLPQCLKFNIRGTELSVVKKKLCHAFRESKLENMLLANSQKLPTENVVHLDFDVQGFIVVLTFHQGYKFSVKRYRVDEAAVICNVTSFFGISIDCEITSLKDTSLFDAMREWLPQRNFDLLYKASREGFEVDVCKKLCNNKGPTLILIFSKNGNLFGGYTPISWQSDGSKHSHPDMFLFTLFNPHNIPPTKYHLKDPNDTRNPGMSCWDSYLFYFGDFYISSRTCICWFGTSRGTFNDTTGKAEHTFTNYNNFSLLEVEVYSVNTTNIH